jgi:hypothetical protein
MRDSKVLNILYPKESKRFIRLKILKDNKPIGWAVVLDTQLSNHKQFGNMRLGSIIDCLAFPENSYDVVKCASGFLKNRGVDLIISNQADQRWCAGLKQAGFFKGPSNFIIAASKKLSELLMPFDKNITSFHINRGDGDGPINL